jgi:sporulation protein YlmC with PRC-barrel domain
MNTSLKALLTVSSLGAALAIAPAIAQTTTPSPAPAATTAAPSSTVISGQALESNHSWRASKLIGLDVYNQSNDKLGDINELILDKDGKVAAVIIGVGGFLGVGERDVAFALSDIKFVEEPRPNVTASNTAVRPGASPSANPTLTNSMNSAEKTPARAATTTVPAYDWVPDHAVINATKEQLNTMAEFKYVTAK